MAIERSQLPAGGDVPQRRVGKSRRFQDRRKVENLSLIRQAVATASVPIANVRIRNRRIRSGVACFVALEWPDAMRPRVVHAQSDAFRRAFAQFEKHAVVTGGTTALNLHQIRDVLTSVLEVDKLQNSAWIRIGCR